jgi:hypothetical protein
VKSYVYMLACPDPPWWPISESPGELINDMVEVSVPVTYETMRHHCEGLVDWLLWKGVVTDRYGMVPRLKASDWVSFQKSWYDSIPCYYVDWSGIEFIWLERLTLEANGIPIRVPPWERGVDPRFEHSPGFPGCNLKIFRPS